MACMYLGGVSHQTNSVVVNLFPENLLQWSSESPVGLAASFIDLWWDINRLIQPKVFSEAYFSMAGVSSGQIRHTP